MTDTFPDIRAAHVVDLGGTVDAWLRAPVRPGHVTVINLFEPGTTDEPWITPILGDACDAVGLLQQHPHVSGPCDIVFSNAVLEHVGGHANRQRFAEAVRGLANRHWVQTPYRYFPLEPHWLFPGFQHLPVEARSQVAARWPLAHTPTRSLDDARESVLWTELIGIAEMRYYFPTSRILRERMFGLTKSIIAVKSD